MTFERLHMLGTNGWLPNSTRHTACFMIEAQKRLIFLDVGTGLCRLLEPSLRRLIASVDEVFIILSHYHYDHIIGMTYVPLFFEGKVVRIFGPGKELSGHRAVDILSNALSSPTFALPLSRFPMDLQVTDLAPGTNHIARDLTVDTQSQEHADPSVGLRLNGGIITYVTDTLCSDDTVTFAKDSQILLHDTYYDHLDFRSAEARGEADTLDHAHSVGVADIAAKARVQRAFFVHLNPEYNQERLTEMEREAQTRFPHVLVPRDLDVIPIGG